MSTDKIVKFSFALSLLTIVAAFYKILHSEYAYLILMIGLVASMVFLIIAIYEVRISKRINEREKIMWTIGFLFMGTLASIFYMLNGRKRIIAKQHNIIK